MRFEPSDRPVLAGRGGGANRVFYSVGGGECGYVAHDPRNPDIFYAGNHSGVITRFNRKTGQSREINPYPDHPMGWASADITERFQWTFPIVISPVDPSVLYVGSQHLWKTTNGGHSWTKISPDLTRHDPKTMENSGGPITKDETGVETYATIFTIAPSPKDVNLIWTGSDDGFVQITRDGGQNWKNVTPKEMPDFSRISLVEASPFRPGTAYVAANHYQHDDFAPYVWRTDDYGETWSKIVTGVARHRLRPRDPRRSEARKAPVPRHRARHLRVVRRRGQLAVAAAEPAGRAGARHQGRAARPRDCNARARLLRDGQHFALAPVGRAADGRPVRFKPEDGLRGLDAVVAVDYALKRPAQQVTVEVLDGAGGR